MTVASEKGAKHYNDWPNTQGFHTTYEEREPVELQIEGHIPPYAAGTLFRTGLGVGEVKTDKGTTYKVNHWFDNFAQVHRFQIHAPEKDGDNVRVTYNSRSTCDGLIAEIKRTGKREGFSFAASYDPCMSVFQKFSGMFKAAVPMRQLKADEATLAVTMTPNFPGFSKTGKKALGDSRKGKVETLCNKSDATQVQFLDPETLEPLGIATQKVLHPELKGPMSAAHAETDPDTGDVYNFNLEFMTKAGGLYRVFHVSAATGKTSILATIAADPAYIHSFCSSEHYLILCVWNSVFTLGGATILWNRNIADAIAPYNSSRRCKWYVIDKKPVEEGGRGHVATYDSDPFYCFHTVNAYEETTESGEVNIVADITTYPNLDIIKRLYVENILSSSASAEKWSTAEDCMARLRRFILPSIPSPSPSTSSPPTTKRTTSAVNRKAISHSIVPHTLSPELPTISPLFRQRKHRYIYGVIHSGKSSLFECIVKYDTDTKTAKTWGVQGHTAGEPIFIPNPTQATKMETNGINGIDGTNGHSTTNGTSNGSSTSEIDEDNGVLLSVVLDGPRGKSYLLCLDAKDLSVLGKVHVDGVIGFGFHGAYVGAESGVRSQLD